MRHDHATSQTGDIMIKHWERLVAGHLPIAIERSQALLLLGIDAQDRVASLEERLDEVAHMAAWCVAMWRVAARQPLGPLAPGHTERSKHAAHDARADRDGLGVQAVGHLLGGHLRPHPVLAHGVARGPVLHRVVHLLHQCGVFAFRLLASASGLADALTSRIIGPLLPRPHAFLHGVRIASKHLRDGLDASMPACDGLDRGQAAAVLVGEALVVLTSLLFDGWAVGLLKVKHHDASSVRQVPQAMNDTDQGVLMNRSKNASPNESGNYFGAMP